MTLEVKEIKVAYIVGKVSEELLTAMSKIEASMYNNEGGAQYWIDALKSRFYMDDEEYIELDRLKSIEGYDYLEY